MKAGATLSDAIGMQRRTTLANKLYEVELITADPSANGPSSTFKLGEEESGWYRDENTSPRRSKHKIAKIKGHRSNVGCSRDREESR